MKIRFFKTIPEVTCLKKDNTLYINTYAFCPIKRIRSARQERQKTDSRNEATLDTSKTFLTKYRAASPVRKFLVRMTLMVYKVLLPKDDKKKHEVRETVSN